MASIFPFQLPQQSRTENAARQGDRHDSGASVADTTLAFSSTSHRITPTTTTRAPTHAPTASQTTGHTSTHAQAETGGIQDNIKHALKTQGIADAPTKLILASWRSGTTKQYATYVKKWSTFCSKKGVDPPTAKVATVLEFLAALFDEGLGHSALNTA